jgi:hypothetical protein
MTAYPCCAAYPDGLDRVIVITPIDALAVPTRSLKHDYR